MNSGQLVCFNEDRNGYPAIAIGACKDAIASVGQLNGFRTARNEAEIVVNDLLRLALVGEDFVVGVEALVGALVEMSVNVIRGKNDQFTGWAGIGRCVQSWTDGIQNETVLIGGAALRQGDNADRGEQVVKLHESFLPRRTPYSMILNEI